MAQTLISIRMDEELKKDFEFICSQLGLSMSAAFTIFAMTVVREQRIPFEIRLQSNSRKVIKKSLEQVRENAEKDGTSKMTMEEIEEEIKKTREEK